ncbi:transcriptional regulator [Pseudoalteromonas sp. ZZD1]|uniref:transcriptional regulator n=1 Tax=Pseudoalteromonas sp. ZZD1 TaxID=3139395 RepID=UPI003BAD201E
MIALDLSIDEFMKPLALSDDKTRLMQIPDVEQWFKSKEVKSSATQRKVIYLAMFLISIGCALFYSGYKNYVFNEKFYEYKSLGVVKAGEPNDIFENWRRYTLFIPNNGNVLKEKRYEMQTRRKELYKLMDEYVGRSFVEEVESGKRVYLLVKVEPHTIEHAGNSWFEFLGIFAAVFGLALALLEPKLTKQ